MKKVLIQLLQPDPDGPVFAKVITTADQMAIQDYAHDHVTRVTRDMLVAGAETAQVAGFAATLTEGLGVEIAAGNAIDEEGVHYQLDAAVEKVLGAADPANPRIDLIYGTLSIDAEAELELQPFRRLRTQGELEANLDPYPPTQYSVATEKHTKLTVNVRVGVPDADPEAPALNAGEVPLWHVRVDAGETELEAGDLTDVRNLMKSLYELMQDVEDIQGTLTQNGLREIVEDVVGALISSPDSSITVVYNDVANTFTTVLPAAYKALLDGATSAATANTLMKRDANADVQARDIKPTRQILFPDSSIQKSLRQVEEYIPIVDLFTPATAVCADAYALIQAAQVNNGGTTYAPVVGELWLDPADYVNVPFVLEAKFFPGATGNGVTLQLYNSTDSAELCAMSKSNTGSAGEEVSRSVVFYLTGSGRKRLVLRHKRQGPGNAETLYLWRARLVAHPTTSNCGFGNSATCAL